MNCGFFHRKGGHQGHYFSGAFFISKSSHGGGRLFEKLVSLGAEFEFYGIYKTSVVFGYFWCGRGKISYKIIMFRIFVVSRVAT